jgi:hypothetical protein
MLKISHVRTVPKSKVVGTEVKPIPLTRKQASSAPVEKDSSAPRHFGTVEKKCQIGTAFSFKQT